MAEARSIANDLPGTPSSTPYYVKQWNHYIPYLKTKIMREVTIAPGTAAKYKFDLAGLLVNELDVLPEYVYPYMMVNGYSCSTDYDGRGLIFKIIDNASLYMLFTKFQADE